MRREERKKKKRKAKKITNRHPPRPSHTINFNVSDKQLT